VAEPEQVDAIVLGLGPGGEDVAGRLAEAGLAVVAIEERLVGGECPYWGCIPSKAMVRAADLLAEARRADGTAGDVAVVPRWAFVAGRVRELTDRWDDTVAVERLKGKGATFVRGRGRLVASDTVEAAGRRFRARRAVVVATGSSPVVPGWPARPSGPTARPSSATTRRARSWSWAAAPSASSWHRSTPATASR
jgi:pyruvate/2-oxoglutarate dehydrogenase complex dihydrolipoamide dehydrogenase (E3) component